MWKGMWHWSDNYFSVQISLPVHLPPWREEKVFLHNNFSDHKYRLSSPCFVGQRKICSRFRNYSVVYELLLLLVRLVVPFTCRAIHCSSFCPLLHSHLSLNTFLLITQRVTHQMKIVFHRIIRNVFLFFTPTHPPSLEHPPWRTRFCVLSVFCEHSTTRLFLMRSSSFFSVARLTQDFTDSCQSNARKFIFVSCELWWLSWKAIAVKLIPNGSIHGSRASVL